MDNLFFEGDGDEVGAAASNCEGRTSFVDVIKVVGTPPAVTDEDVLGKSFSETAGEVNVVVTSEVEPHEKENISSEPSDLEVELELEVETGSDDEEDTFRANGVAGGIRWA